MSAFIALGVDAVPEGASCAACVDERTRPRKGASISAARPVFGTTRRQSPLREPTCTVARPTARRLRGVLYGVRDQSVVQFEGRGRDTQQIGILTIGAEERI